MCPLRQMDIAVLFYCTTKPVCFSTEIANTVQIIEYNDYLIIEFEREYIEIFQPVTYSELSGRGMKMTFPILLNVIQGLSYSVHRDKSCYTKKLLYLFSGPL